MQKSKSLNSLTQTLSKFTIRPQTDNYDQIIPTKSLINQQPRYWPNEQKRQETGKH